jgi:hypothetical protein
VCNFVRHSIVQDVIECFAVEHVAVEAHEVVPAPAVRHSSTTTNQVEPDTHCIEVEMGIQLLGFGEACFASIHDLLLLGSHFVSFSVLRYMYYATTGSCCQPAFCLLGPVIH